MRYLEYMRYLCAEDTYTCQSKLRGLALLDSKDSKCESKVKDNKSEVESSGN